MLMWIFKIALKGLLLLISSIYAFLPTKYTLKFPRLKVITLISAILLAIWIIGEEIVTYHNYSYAIVAEDGNISKSRNFEYSIKKITYEGNPAYIIENKWDKDNLYIKSDKATTVEKVSSIDGIRIIFIGSGAGDPIISTGFEVEIRK